MVEDVRMATSQLASSLSRDQVKAADPPGSPRRIVVGDRDYLDRALMRELSAGAVALWFSDAGKDNSGPKSEGEVFEALLSFGSGTALLCREAAAWPRTPDVPVASLQTGLIGALLAVAMLGGPGNGLIDVSGEMASLVFTSVMYVEEVLGDTQPAELEGRTARGPKGLIGAADGQVLLTCVDDRQWMSLVGLMGSPRLAASEEYRDPLSRGANQDVLLQLIRQWSRAHPKIELFEMLQRERIPAAPGMTVREVLDLQFNVEGRLEEVARAGGPPVRLPRALVGDAHPSVSAGRSARWWHRPASAAPVPGTLPLAGSTVVEWAHAFAGPLAGQLLAQLGANVIKIESATHPDISRMTPPFAIAKGGRPGPEAGTHYLALNNGKRSIAINLEHSASRPIVRKLLSRGRRIRNQLLGAGAQPQRARPGRSAGRVSRPRGHPYHWVRLRPIRRVCGFRPDDLHGDGLGRDDGGRQPGGSNGVLAGHVVRDARRAGHGGRARRSKPGRTIYEGARQLDRSPAFRHRAQRARWPLSQGTERDRLPVWHRSAVS